jgi:DNA-binding NtrC family response regulator
VLLTDDSRDAVAALAMVLEHHGYRVTPTHSAEEALDALDRETGIQVVVSDVRMPGVDGFDFLRVVRHRYPSLRMILVTGHLITDDDVVPHGAAILQKPVNVAALLKLLPPVDTPSSAA